MKIIFIAKANRRQHQILSKQSYSNKVTYFIMKKILEKQADSVKNSAGLKIVQNQNVVVLLLYINNAIKIVS